MTVTGARGSSALSCATVVRSHRSAAGPGRTYDSSTSWKVGGTGSQADCAFAKCAIIRCSRQHAHIGVQNGVPDETPEPMYLSIPDNQLCSLRFTATHS